MQPISPLDIFLISSQVIDFYWIMLAKSSPWGIQSRALSKSKST